MDPTHSPLELVPLDQAQAPAPVAGVPLEIEIVPMGTLKSASAEPAANTDRFLKEAIKQYEEGHIDQPLWDRALVQARDDKTAATETYLRARATALRLLDREFRSGQRKGLTAAPAPRDAATPDVSASAAIAVPPLQRLFTRHRYPAIIATALVPIVVGGWLLSGYFGDSAKAVAVAQSAPVGVRPTSPPKALEAATESKVAAEDGKRPGATPEFLGKIQQLNDAGNWNVLVLYAVEWTRLEPTNAAAWNQLRAGYINLRQYGDAFDAATKAVQLAPADSRMWRNLGQVNMDLNDPAEALRVFDKAVALSPDDAPTLCLRTSVAQLAGAQKDAKAAAKQSASFDSKCRGLIEPVAQR
jgi:tetratricopeptide (TPR) repeat protein